MQRDDFTRALRRRAQRIDRKRRHDCRSLVIFILLALALFGWRAMIRAAGSELARRQVAQMGLQMTERGPAWYIDMDISAAEGTSPAPDRATAVPPYLRPPGWTLGERTHPQAGTDRIGPWTWANQYNTRREEEAENDD